MSSIDTPQGTIVASARSGLASAFRAVTVGRIELSAIDALCVAYLAAPLALFLIFFSALWIAIAGALGAAVLLVRARVSAPQPPFPILRGAAAALGALLLCVLFGIFPPFNPPGDWSKHYAVFNLLIESPWPVVMDDGSTTLRYYLGLYLPPSFAAKLFGPDTAPFFLFAWAWAGIFLALMVLSEGWSGWRAAAVPALFLAFGGADIVGSLLFHPELSFGVHLEWWATFVSLTSNLTLLMWAPQHAIPAWLVAALLLRRGDWVLSIAGPILVAVCLWSPFVSLGLVPFFALRVIQDRCLVQSLTPENLLFAPAIGIPIAAYLLHGTEAVVAGPIWRSDADFSWIAFFAFYCLEFLFIVAALAWVGTRRPSWLVAAVAVLLLFPLYRLGTYNDFAMRATVPALSVLAILVAGTLVTTPLRRSWPIAALIAIGAIGPVSDIVGISSFAPYRGIFQRYDLQTFLAVRDPQEDLRPQYAAAYPHWSLSITDRDKWSNARTAVARWRSGVHEPERYGDDIFQWAEPVAEMEVPLLNGKACLLLQVFGTDRTDGAQIVKLEGAAVEPSAFDVAGASISAPKQIRLLVQGTGAAVGLRFVATMPEANPSENPDQIAYGMLMPPRLASVEACK